MYLLTNFNVKKNQYEVYDTSDGVCEYYNFRQLLGFHELGIKIHGFFDNFQFYSGLICPAVLSKSSLKKKGLTVYGNPNIPHKNLSYYYESESFYKDCITNVSPLSILVFRAVYREEFRINDDKLYGVLTSIYNNNFTTPYIPNLSNFWSDDFINLTKGIEIVEYDKFVYFVDECIVVRLKLDILENISSSITKRAKILTMNPTFDYDIVSDCVLIGSCDSYKLQNGINYGFRVNTTINTLIVPLSGGYNVTKEGVKPIINHLICNDYVVFTRLLGKNVSKCSIPLSFINKSIRGLKSKDAINHVLQLLINCEFLITDYDINSYYKEYNEIYDFLLSTLKDGNYNYNILKKAFEFCDSLANQLHIDKLLSKEYVSFKICDIYEKVLSIIENCKVNELHSSFLRLTDIYGREISYTLMRQLFNFDLPSHGFKVIYNTVFSKIENKIKKDNQNLTYMVSYLLKNISPFKLEVNNDKLFIRVKYPIDLKCNTEMLPVLVSTDKQFDDFSTVLRDLHTLVDFSRQNDCKFYIQPSHYGEKFIIRMFGCKEEDIHFLPLDDSFYRIFKLSCTFGGSL